MLFKIQHGIIDATPDFVLPKAQRTIESLRLRQLQATNDIYKYSFSPQSISDWNRLPTSVTNHQTPGIQERPSQPASFTPTRFTTAYT